MLAVVGGDGSAAAASGFAEALALRIARETGVRARAHHVASPDPVPACDAVVWWGLSDPAALDPAVDLVLLLDEDARGDGAAVWRDALMAAGLPWARVLVAAGAGTGRAVRGVPPPSGPGACSDLLDRDRAADVDAALDAAAPLLRRRARPGAGLFTRLAQRDAAHAGWRWTCDSCDVPECEHALRVASRMDTEPTLR